MGKFEDKINSVYKEINTNEQIDENITDQLLSESRVSDPVEEYIQKLIDKVYDIHDIENLEYHREKFRDRIDDFVSDLESGKYGFKNKDILDYMKNQLVPSMQKELEGLGSKVKLPKINERIDYDQMNERTTTVSFIRVLQELEIQMSNRFTESRQLKFADKIADIRQEWLYEGNEDWNVDIGKIF